MHIYKTQAQINEQTPCPCGAENWRTSKLYCSDCRQDVQPTTLDEMRRNQKIRAILNVVASHRPERRADALADFATLTQQAQAMQAEVTR